MTCKVWGCLRVLRGERSVAWSHWSVSGEVRGCPVTRCHDTSRRHPEYEDSENIPRCREDSDGGSGGEKTNQVCEHYSARKLCFKCEKLWKDGRMLRVGASQIHNGPKKEAAGCKWTLQQLELKVTMSGSGRRLVGAKSEICRTQREFIWVYYESHHFDCDIVTSIWPPSSGTMTGPVNVIRRASWWICLTSFPFYCQPFKIISIIHYSHQCK